MTHVPLHRRQFLAGAMSFCLAPGAMAQPATEWPARPIKLVVGYAPGGGTDVIARLVAAKMGDELGQQVVVENRPGANTNIAAEWVARAPADGYTLFMYQSANTTNATLYKTLRYDPVHDFEFAGLITKISNVLVVSPKLPVRSLADYVQYAGQAKGGVTFASAGSGSSIHLSGEMFKTMTKAPMVHVPYKGSAPAITDLLGGQVDSMFDNINSALLYVQSGRLRAIAVTGSQRSPLLPDVPTVSESGYLGFEVSGWYGLAAPAKTPAVIVEKLNSALVKVMARPEVTGRLKELGATPVTSTPAQMRKFATEEVERWRDVIKQSGATAD